MIPAVPFAVLFEAIVAAQAPECYTRSGIYLNLPGCLSPKPPEHSIIVIPTPTQQEWDNHDVVIWCQDWRTVPRMPSYFVKRATCPELPDGLKHRRNPPVFEEGQEPSIQPWDRYIP
jgi:hypothetical protein